MERYKGDFEAVRAKTARLRAERETREAQEAAAPVAARPRARKA